MHSRTTAPEILDAFADLPLDAFVTGAGTGGTLKGVARVLKEQSPQTRIVVCEPDNSPVLGSGIGQKRGDDGRPAESHPMARPHVMQGWSPDFIPKLTEDALPFVDRVLGINGADAMRLARELAQREGIFCGISGGATVAGALQLATELPAGANVRAMLPETGERYLGTQLCDGIGEDMDEAEWAISRSTPGARFDAPPPAPSAATSAPKPAPAPAWPAPSPELLDFVERVVRVAEQTVVLSGLERCEFCWALRNVFAGSDIA